LDNFLNGFWMIGGVLVAYIIRKPGAALAGEMIAAITEVPLTPWGALVPIILGLLQGAGAEAVFAANRYRSFNFLTLCIAGIVAHLCGMLYSFWVSGYGAFEFGVIALLVVVRIVSGIVLVGIPAKLIGDALVPTGVLDGFAISRERQAEV
jgi:energy-coupling factor transport system substrate-specific component